MADSIFRIEERDDRIGVVTKNWIEFADPRKKNPLTQEHPDFFIDLGILEKDPIEGTVRVGTAMHPDGEDSFRIHGANGIYAEVPLTERELTDAEIEWCEDTFMYGGNDRPETVVEFEIPNPEDLRTAVLQQNLDAFPELTTQNPNHDARHEMLKSIQESLEESRFLQTKLDSRKGYLVDIAPEWDPEDSHNEDRDADVLNSMAGMRSDAHHVDFETVAGFEYRAFFNARARHLDIHEPKLDYRDLPAVDVVGAPDWSYCQVCAGVLPEEEFLHVQRRGYNDGVKLRSCDDCAESEHTRHFDEESVSVAKDDRAKRLGGQRRLSGAFRDIQQEANEGVPSEQSAE